jgi:CheY-like chemotaxis protein
MGNAKKILVVDDDEVIMKLLVKRLSTEGYTVCTAKNGKEGLAAAAREVPDLIVSDIDMPEMDGREMASKLKASNGTSKIPLIFLTATIDKNESGKKSSDEYLYISKMCKPTDLLDAIRARLALPS